MSIIQPDLPIVGQGVTLVHELHLRYDQRTGNIEMGHSKDLLILFGMLEQAKVMLREQQAAYAGKLQPGPSRPGNLPTIPTQ